MGKQNIYPIFLRFSLHTVPHTSDTTSTQLGHPDLLLWFQGEMGNQDCNYICRYAYFNDSSNIIEQTSPTWKVSHITTYFSTFLSFALRYLQITPIPTFSMILIVQCHLSLQGTRRNEIIATFEVFLFQKVNPIVIKLEQCIQINSTFINRIWNVKIKLSVARDSS